MNSTTIQHKYRIGMYVYYPCRTAMDTVTCHHCGHEEYRWAVSVRRHKIPGVRFSWSVPYTGYPENLIWYKLDGGEFIGEAYLYTRRRDAYAAAAKMKKDDL